MAKAKAKPEPGEITEPETTAETELVKMVRDSKPFTADVHPAEVENYRLAGWQVVETPKGK